MAKLPSGIRARGKSELLEISYYYKGRRLTEFTGLKATKQNIKHVETLRNAMMNAIKLDKLNGTENFKISDYFPNSKNINITEDENPIDTNATYAQYAEIYEKRIKDRIESGELKHSSLKSYRAAMKKLKASKLYKMKLKDIKKIHIQEYITQLLKTLSPKSVNNMLTPLRQVLEQAFEDEVINTNPADRVKNPKFSKPEIYPFSKEEVEKILAHYEKHYPEHVAYIAFLFFTGCRVGEALAAKWENLTSTGSDWTYHIKENRVEGRMTTPKTREGKRIVPVMDDLKKYLIKQRPQSFMAGDFIFVNPRTKEPYHKNTHIIEGTWKPTLKSLKIAYRDMRELRHTHAIISLILGDNIHDVAKRLGHTDTSTTIRTYARYLKEYTSPSKLNSVFSANDNEETVENTTL